MLRWRNISSVGTRATHYALSVTGATGFFGQHLGRVLLRDGHDVIALMRQPKQAAWPFDGEVRCVGSMDELSASGRVGVVVNLASACTLGPG